MFSKVSIEMIDELSHTMQDIDKESIYTLAGISPKEGLLSSVKNSKEAFAYLINGKVAAIAGLSKVTPFSEWACPWLVCSDIIYTHPITFLRQTKKWVDEKVEEHDILRNVVYSKHKNSIRWLKWLGFKFYDLLPLGINGELFYLHELRK